MPPLLLLGMVAWAVQPRLQGPLDLTYEIDLARAPQGQLTLTMILDGDLPRDLDLQLSGADGGDFEDEGDVRDIGDIGDIARGPGRHLHLHPPLAAALTADGTPIAPLEVSPIPGGWRLHAGKARRAGVIYQVDFARASSLEGDVRRHLSTPVAGGVRAAGFEIFLEPVGHPVGPITIALHNPGRLPCLVPWPALLQEGRVAAVPPGGRLIQPANLAFGMGYRPAAEVPGHTDTLRTAPRPDAFPVPANLLFHPQDLKDLNNSLLICGNLVTATSQARDCVIQFATDRQWSFPVPRAVDLVRRIARTEIAFFGTAPTSQITVLLAANDITAAKGFDAYGVHTGSSVLVLLDPEATWEQFQENVASVIAHEMFHGWLGEAVPQTDPSTLWFTEGATTWFAARMLTAGGVWSPDHAREVLRGRLERDYLGSPLRGRVSPATASAEVMADPGQVRFAYASALASCMALDDWLSRRTGTLRPLDRILRTLYERRDGRPLCRMTLQETVWEATGIDCEEWLDTHVYGKAAVSPVAELI